MIILKIIKSSICHHLVDKHLLRTVVAFCGTRNVPYFESMKSLGLYYKKNQYLDDKFIDFKHQLKKVTLI